MTDNKDLKYIQQFKKEPNIPKTYEQFVLEDKQLTPEQGQNLYPDLEYGDISEQRGYGPTDKGKKKSIRRQNNNDSEYNQQHLISTLNNKWGDKCNLWNEEASGHEFDNGFQASSISTSSCVSSGAGGMLASGGVSFSGFKTGDDTGEVRFADYSLGGEVGAGLGGVTAGYTARADVINANAGGVNARIGLDGSSNFTAGPGGVEVKAAGFGVSVGKKTGVSTPFGEVSVDFEETCNQQ